MGDCLVTDAPFVERGAQFTEITGKSTEGSIHTVTLETTVGKLRLPAFATVLATVNIEVER